MTALARPAPRVRYGDFFFRRHSRRSYVVFLPAEDSDGIEHLYVSAHPSAERAAEELRALREGREL